MVHMCVGVPMGGSLRGQRESSYGFSVLHPQVHNRDSYGMVYVCVWACHCEVSGNKVLTGDGRSHAFNGKGDERSRAHDGSGNGTSRAHNGNGKQVGWEDARSAIRAASSCEIHRGMGRMGWRSPNLRWDSRPIPIPVTFSPVIP